MIAFYKLFDLLNRRDINVEELRIGIKASSSTMSKMRQNKIVSLDVILRICQYLDCQPSDIMEYIKVEEK